MYRSPEWNIYLCRYVMKMLVKNASHKERYLLKSILFQCDNPEEAYKKAVKCIPLFSDNYKDESGDIVEIKCCGLNDIELLQDTWNQILEDAQDDYGYDMSDLLLDGSEFKSSGYISEKEGLSIFK